jgi:hypothetical protein
MRRFALISNGLGLIGYLAIAVPLRLSGLALLEMTWFDALFVMPLLFPMLASVLILPTYFPDHESLCIMVPSAIYIAVGLAAIGFERGW